MMKIIISLLILIVTVPLYAEPPKRVTFATADGGKTSAEFYPSGSHGVLLAHGAIFNKESWKLFADQLTEQGFSVLAIDFRGYGKSTAGKNPAALYEDILAGVNFLQNQTLINKVSVIGASMGGAAAAEAVINAKPGTIDKLVLLSPAGFKHPEKLNGKILFIASSKESMVRSIKSYFARAPEPKSLQLIEGTAHAQDIFKTDQANFLSRIILNFLKSETD